MSTQAPETAMVFAAGLGSRMLPLTLTTPKPMIKVGGRPMIDHMLDRFASAGARRAVVNVHHLADQVESHVLGRSDLEIIVSDERAKLLDQGGGLKKALPFLGEKPIYVANTDALWIEGPRQNLLRLAELWDPERMDILLLVAATTASVGVDWPGDFYMAVDGRLTRRPEREVAPFVYAGVGIVKPALFAGRAEDVFPLSPYFFEAALHGRLYGLRLDGVWRLVGAPRVIAEADWEIARRAT
ncbi:nucleotidyltransferase family protein [Methylocella sp.]|uniref:nucleotidyltransferase family protein n=1 Tax=Methylocella sp. TaxID=1978226 RepID=UPI0037837425